MPEVISRYQEIGEWILIVLDVTAMRLMILCGLSRISSISLSLKRSGSGSGTSTPMLAVGVRDVECCFQEYL
jgi:hypothetical protein